MSREPRRKETYEETGEEYITDQTLFSEISYLGMKLNGI